MSLFRFLKIKFFNSIYGKIIKSVSVKNNKNISSYTVFFNKRNSYKIYKIKNARSFQGSIHDNALIINNMIIDSPSYQYRYKNKLILNGKISENIVFKEGTPKFKKNIKGSVFILLTGGAGKDNYFHWLFDVLPRLAILKKSSLNTKNFKFLFPSLKLNFQRESLKKMKISYARCLDGGKYKHFSAENIIVTDHPYVKNNNPTSSIKNLPLWIIEWLRKQFIEKNYSKKNISRKIYIDRSDSKFSKNRHIVNENEVKKYLVSVGFKIIILSKLNFISQIHIFNNANIIIGAHGAGFANLVFSKPKTKIIELQSKASGDVIKNLAKKCKLNYQRILSKNKKKNFKNPHGKIFINLEELKRKIKL